MWFTNICKDWFWIPCELNVSDFTTQGRKTENTNEGPTLQNDTDHQVNLQPSQRMSNVITVE